MTPPGDQSELVSGCVSDRKGPAGQGRSSSLATQKKTRANRARDGIGRLSRSKIVKSAVREGRDRKGYGCGCGENRQDGGNRVHCSSPRNFSVDRLRIVGGCRAPSFDPDIKLGRFEKVAREKHFALHSRAVRPILIDHAGGVEYPMKHGFLSQPARRSDDCRRRRRFLAQPIDCRRARKSPISFSARNCSVTSNWTPRK